MSRLKSAIRNLSAIGGSAFGGQSSILLALLAAGMLGVFAPRAQAAVSSTGATVTTNPCWIVHSFTNTGSVGTFTVSDGGQDVEYLVVAGGGGGGGRYSSTGGAGAAVVRFDKPAGCCLCDQGRNRRRGMPLQCRSRQWKAQRPEGRRQFHIERHRRNSPCQWRRRGCWARW